MFIRSRMEKDVIYRRKGGVWVIKAGSVTFVDENKVTARELKSLYGSRIEIISRDKLESGEEKIPVKKEVRLVENKREAQIKPEKKPLDETLIKDILTEIKDEIPVKKDEIKVEIIDPIKEAFMTGVGSEVIEPKKERPLKVTKDAIGDLVLEPVHAGADLKIELDVVQPAEVKKEESVVETGKEISVLKEEEKGEGEQKTPVLDKPRKSSRKGPGKRARAKRANANK